MISANAYPFLDPKLPLEDRVEDLISRFTVEEKVSLMCQHQAEIPRLGVKPYKHGTEGAHGVAWLGEATVFPQNTGLASTWDPELMRQIGSVIGDEARIFFQKNPVINGLTIWAPTVDMERDPRWGRTEEAYGEDPHLTGELTSGLVKGLQGDHPFYYKAVATLKHFYANNNELNRGWASISVDPRNKREYYLKAFEPAFRKGGAASMMTAYNSINGVPCNLNAEVNEIVKGEWGMNGFVVSDAGDVLGTVNDHHYVDSYAKAVAETVKNGVDSITDDHEISQRALRDALEQGLLVEADLDRALKNTFRVRFRLGEFDPQELNPYAHIDEAKLCSDEHNALALKAARESIVLLKNSGLLPLDKQAARSVAVIGPLVDEAFTDWYSGTPKYRTSPLAGIKAKLAAKAEVVFCEGSDEVRIRSVKTGKYAVIGSGESRGLAAVGEAADSAVVFRLTDWGWGSNTLREPGPNGKFVTETEEGTLAVLADEARGWFVKEAFGLEPDEEGKTRLTTWNGRLVGLQPDGGLAAAGRREAVASLGGIADVVDESGTEGSAEADRFELELVQDGIAAAAAAAKAAETAVVVVGNVPFINGKEEIDRKDITLPPKQHELIKAVCEANPNTVVVIVGSYPFAVNWEDEHVPAILYMSHAAQGLGSALSDVLFGDYNPAGRLPMTWYRSIDQLPDLMDYDIIKGKRTYQYFDGEPLYPFGHGLSYTTFEYSEIHVGSGAEFNGSGAELDGSGEGAGGSSKGAGGSSKGVNGEPGDSAGVRAAVEGSSESAAGGEAAIGAIGGCIIDAGGDIAVSVTVANTGDRFGEEVVQLYVRANESRVPRPLKSLKGFKRIGLEAGESRTVEFTLPAAELAFWDVTRSRYVVESGTYSFFVGSSSQKLQLAGTVTVNGETIPPRSLTEFVAAVNYDDYEGVYLDENVEGGSSIRVKKHPGRGWIAFKDVEFGGHAPGNPGKLTARIACAAQGAALEVRLGAPDGTLIGQSPVPRTGGSQAFTTLEVKLQEEQAVQKAQGLQQVKELQEPQQEQKVQESQVTKGVSGRCDVYLVLHGEVTLSKFRIV